MKFLSLRVRNALVMHGYDDENVEVVEELQGQQFMEKLVAVDRIQSVSENYLLVSSSHGRVMYWEYEGGIASVRQRLAAAGLMVD